MCFQLQRDNQRHQKATKTRSHEEELDCGAVSREAAVAGNALSETAAR
jgi:hypothetical protein